MRRRQAVALVALLVMSVGTGANLVGSPAAALSASDIQLSALSVNQGSGLGVKITRLQSAQRCVLRLLGPESSQPRTVSVRNSRVKATLSTAGLPVIWWRKRGGQGRDRTVDLPIFRLVRTMRIGLDSHSRSVVVSCESLTIRLSAAESVHIPCT
jgi:hypothetical protein